MTFCNIKNLLINRNTQVLIKVLFHVKGEETKLTDACVKLKLINGFKNKTCYLPISSNNLQAFRAADILASFILFIVSLLKSNKPHIKLKFQ